MKKILGLSAFYHDAAAALIINNEIIAAAQEERFSREKHTSKFPINAIKYLYKKTDDDHISLSQLVITGR